MESLDSEPCSMDELLNFSSDIDDEHHRPDPPVRPLLELVEEDLEWISNKDAFPAVESFVGVIPDHPPSTTDSALKHLSPVSVLEGSTVTSHSTSSHGVALTSCFGGLKAPRRARSKRRCRRRQLCWSHQPARPEKPAVAAAAKKKKKSAAASAAAIGGWKCQHCGAEKTPQWRAGPQGAKTLCNACGVRFKSGRLVPEYRPASSPSFSSELHSNSHRKILEMRGRR